MPYRLPDGETVRCSHVDKTDEAPHFSYECDIKADERIDPGEATVFNRWIEDHPRTLIWFRSKTNTIYLCKRHANLWRDLV